MEEMAADLGTELDWIAVDHHNTAHPHTHIVLRGVDDRGKDLVIARDYISHGLRRRASEIVTLELGPRTDLEIERDLRREIERDRFTGLDRRLLDVPAADEIDLRIVDMRYDPERGDDRFRRGLLMGRLEKLSRLGVAREVETGVWRLAGDMEERLRALGRRDDIFKAMCRDLRQAGLDRAPTDYATFDPEAGSDKALVGQVVSVGLSNELYDRFYLLVDGIDGRIHYVDVGHRNDDDDLAPGVIVEVRAKPAGPREVDRTIDRVARASGGTYSIDAHLEQERRDTPAFAETHVRRLDHQLLARSPLSLRSAGFGLEVERALARRQDHLVEEGLAERRDEGVIHRRNLLDILRARELACTADQISKELALPYRPARDREQIVGIYRRPLRLASGKYALIERVRVFTLVPWRPVLERNRGKAVSGILRGQSISWTLTRQRGLGIE